MRVARISLRAISLALLAGGLLVTGSISAMTSNDEHPGSLAALLANKDVGKELKLSSLQAAVLKSLQEEYREEIENLTDPMPTTVGARTAAKKKLRSLMADFNTRALSILNQAQRARFAEIEHQALGANSLTRPSVQEALDLTEDQKRKVEKIRRKGLDYLNKINRQHEDGKVTPVRRLELLSRRRIALTKDLLKILSPEQKAVLAQLGGKPISAQPAPR